MNRGERYRNVNPQYSSSVGDWVLCDDCYSGEREIKQRGELYLPRTEGQMADSRFGLKRYEAYKNRAVYFNYFANSVVSMMGILHSEAPEALELPEKLSVLREDFSGNGTSFASFLRQVNQYQLIFGRCGVLLDVPEWDESPSAVPRGVLYPPHRILDWNGENGELTCLLLDESGERIEGTSLRDRKFLPRFRVCGLDRNHEYWSLSLTPEEYQDLDLTSFRPEEAYPVTGGCRCTQIPFVFFNASDNGADVRKPPLLPLANVCLAIYRSEADYRHALFMQAQSTLFLKGFSLDGPPMMGAGNYIHTEEVQAEGKFLEVSGSGLTEMRLALNDLHENARSLGVTLNEFGYAESGEALKTRMNIKTTMLRSIASAAETGFQSLLKTAALWCGADPERVLFKPNTDFSSTGVTAGEVLQLWNAKSAGLPISGRSIHDWLRKNDFTDLSYDEELKEIREGE